MVTVVVEHPVWTAPCAEGVSADTQRKGRQWRLAEGTACQVGWGILGLVQGRSLAPYVSYLGQLRH